MRLNNQAYTWTVTTQLNSGPIQTAASPTWTGYVEPARHYIKVLDYLVDPYAFNTTITLMISGISNARSNELIPGIHFEITTVVNTLPIEHGVTPQYQAQSNSITSASIVQSTNNRFETGTVDVLFTTSTTVDQGDFVLLRFPEGVTINYDFSWVANSGFSGTLKCIKISELEILVESGFSGAVTTAPGAFSLTINGVYGYLDWHVTESLVISVI